MAACDINTLLADARCLDQLDNHRLNVLIATLWCQVSEAITPVPPVPEGAWWNPDEGAGIAAPDEGGVPIVNPDA